MALISEVNSINFDEFTNQSGISVIDIATKWCGPCRVLSPIIDAVSAEFNRDGLPVRIGKMDADTNRDITTKLNITSVPTILIYKDGILVDRNNGMIPKNKLIELIKKYI